MTLKLKKPDWNKYESTTKKYLGRDIFSKSPLTSGMLTEAAKMTYEKTGVFVPAELALSQAQFETFMGTKGRNPGTNPFNVGEYDEGTKIEFETLKQGVQSYYNLMANDYLGDNSVVGLLENFVNSKGNRYASDPGYESKISTQMDYITRNYGAL